MEHGQGRRWAPLSCLTDEEEGKPATPRRGRDEEGGGGGGGGVIVRQCEDEKVDSEGKIMWEGMIGNGDKRDRDVEEEKKGKT